MTIHEYIDKIQQLERHVALINDIEDRYQMSLPEVLKDIISNSREPVFLEDDVRILSISEILNANKTLSVDFIALGMIPFADCYDNDFAVYCRDGKWAIFNIIDECKFDETDDILNLFAN